MLACTVAALMMLVTAAEGDNSVGLPNAECGA